MSTRIGLIAIALCLVGCAEAALVPDAPDAGGIRREDAGVEPARDAGLPDAAAPVDAGTVEDDAGSPDASELTVPEDAGEPFDAGAPECPVLVAAPDEDPWDERAASAGFGGLVEQATGGHRDVFLDSPTQYIRIGARLDWGGTVVFFGLRANAASNVIDANDTGRELQIAVYDPDRVRQGCAATATCQATSASCGDSITYLGWNPVQGGDECGHGGRVLSYGRSGDALRLVVRPMHWNPDWDAPDCRSSACGPAGREADVTYTFDLRFVREHVVEVATQVVSEEDLDHAVTAQEWPTLYVAHGQGGPDLPVFLDASGNQPVIGTPANDGFFVGDFTSSEPWFAFQDTARTYGVGLAMDQGVREFQGWRGDGRSAPYFHNVRARLAFGLPPRAVVRGISYLALGNFDTVRSELRAALAARPPFGIVDVPSAGAPTVIDAGDPVRVAGWVLDTEAPADVRVERDGEVVAHLPRTSARPDVCVAYPAYAGCPNVGFDGSIDTTGWSRCGHLLRIVARDGDGNETVLGERVVQVR